MLQTLSGQHHCVQRMINEQETGFDWRGTKMHVDFRNACNYMHFFLLMTDAKRSFNLVTLTRWRFEAQLIVDNSSILLLLATHALGGLRFSNGQPRSELHQITLLPSLMFVSSCRNDLHIQTIPIQPLILWYNIHASHCMHATCKDWRLDHLPSCFDRQKVTWQELSRQSFWA